MTLTELLAQLEANNAKSSGFRTSDQLKGMGASASVDLAKPSGAVTLLYSGESGVSLLDARTGQQVSVSNTVEVVGQPGDHEPRCINPRFPKCQALKGHAPAQRCVHKKWL